LKEINQTLGSITAQTGLAQFLSNSKDAQELNGLVEDIRDAFIGYQVCGPKLLTCIAPNVPQTSLQQDIYNEHCQIVSFFPLLLDHVYLLVNRELRTTIFCRTCTTPLRLGTIMGIGRVV
jgi:hypothetical protein